LCGLAGDVRNSSEDANASRAEEGVRSGFAIGAIKILQGLVHCGAKVVEIEGPVTGHSAGLRARRKRKRGSEATKR
jgi:hypothetical protein